MRWLSDSDGVFATGADDSGWDEYGERIVATGICEHCGEGIDQWEVRIEPGLRVRRPVVLWKHHGDGAVLCGRAQPAAPVEPC